MLIWGGLGVGHLLVVEDWCEALPLLEGFYLPDLPEEGLLLATLFLDHLVVALLLLVAGVFAHEQDLLLDLLLVLLTHVDVRP